tara:strand:- start:2698 stop:5427 length:2730 start_codon:yes stop_codon:yes gene_type:complete
MPRKFDFISPGILLNEVDESVLPAETQDEGPLLIGRALTGPSMQPVRVSNLEDLYAIFGQPVTGKGALNSDIWRDGNLVAPTYAMFAAQAHLASGTTPVTFMRLSGREHSNKSGGGEAGWKLTGDINAGVSGDNVAPYGLFTFESGSAAVDGVLSAVFYVTGASLALSGTNADGAANTVAAAEVIEYNSTTDYTLVLRDGVAADKEFVFNFDSTSERYIRNVFNTNPQKLEASTNFGTSNDKLFLGETFELAENDISDSDRFAVIMPLVNDDESSKWSNRQMEAKKGSTGWFVNRQQDGSHAELFKLHAHAAGEYISANYWINIEDLRLGTSVNPNSSFTVKVMRNGTAVETFVGCNLNPSSESYIAKKIGDQYQVWDDSEKKFNVNGLYPNISDYFYVEVHPSIENQTISDSFALPVGFQLPAVHPNIVIEDDTAFNGHPTALIKGGNTIPFIDNASAGSIIGGMPAALQLTIKFPTIKLTKENSNGNSNYPASSVFGLRHIKDNATEWDASYADVVRANPTTGTFTSSGIFTLEDVKEDTTTGLFYHESGSASHPVALTGDDGLFTKGIRKFAAPVVGGFEGVNIFKTDPFSSNLVGSGRKSSYVRNTLEFALDLAADADVTEYDLLSIPGQTKDVITNRVISICETRGDALAIVDLEKIYKNTWESTGSADTPKVSEAVKNAQTRSINSSFAATYYPSVRMQDMANGNRDVIIVPPSVAAIGAIAKSQAVSDPWFAPAGFNRGGINELGGTQGPRVLGTVEHLSKANRDSLYEENINPIARFPASGDIVIFGQKTMQQLPSALDRINVRRLLLFIKRRIGKVSETILFDQNVQATWNRFRAQAERILSDVQSRLGIVEYKLVLDETTTTADLVDRNILYAKVLIKPARALEFIVVDFVVTRSGIEL